LPLTFQAARFDGAMAAAATPHFTLNGHASGNANTSRNGVDAVKNLADYPRQPR
jgi:hypothetical protein